MIANGGLTRLIENVRGLLKKLAGSNQRGFTLIEMLVVISILGILAAVVTMSMVGVTNLAQSRANDAEKKTAQVALDTMANEQQIDAATVCTGTAATTPTKNMATFPVASSSPAGSQPPVGSAAPLYPRYLRQAATHASYTCDATGVVSQTP